MLGFLGNPPFFTVFVMVLCIVLSIVHPPLDSSCLMPMAVIPSLQVQRIFIAPFLHLDIFHLLLNMLAWLSIARDFEYTVGTLPTIYTILVLLIPLCALLHIFTAFFLDLLLGTLFSYDCAVGLSGILFALLVINLHNAGNSHASLLGLISIPVRWYPLLLVALIQLLFPDISLLGHLAGVAGGHIVCRDLLRSVTPSNDAMSRFEDRCNLPRWPAWQPVPTLFGQFLGSASAASRSPSFVQRMQSSWRSFMARMSSNNTSDNNDPSVDNSAASGGGSRVSTMHSISLPDGTSAFAGTGHTLGGSAPDLSPGRVPLTSRLLQQEESHRRGRAPAPALAPAPPVPSYGATGTGVDNTETTE